jgi:ABC-2 type transport system ATP-binding protein
LKCQNQNNGLFDGRFVVKAIESKKLAKSYCVQKSLLRTLLYPFGASRTVCALDSVSFTINPGEILGVVGPNGAGKTTLLKILAGLLEQDKGEVKIFGSSYSNGGKALRRNIGYVSSDERSFFWRLSGRDNLEFFGRLYGISSTSVQLRVEQLLGEFQFETKADRLFGEYSAGMRKKVAVMRALLHEPMILLLDEVTNSLDPDSAEYVKNVIRHYINDKPGRAAVWCTHRLEEIPSICDQVISLDSGKIVSADEVTRDHDVHSLGQYLLKTKPMNGQLQSFCSTFQDQLEEATVGGDCNAFLFKDIGQDKFSDIVSMAVKDYGAYVLFAGYLKKEAAGGDN